MRELREDGAPRRPELGTRLASPDRLFDITPHPHRDRHGLHQRTHAYAFKPPLPMLRPNSLALFTLAALLAQPIHALDVVPLPTTTPQPAATDAAPFWSGSRDEVSATASMLMTPRGPRITCRVTDPRHDNVYAGPHVWRGDCLYIGFDGRGDTPDQSDALGTDDGALLLALGADGPSARVLSHGSPEKVRALHADEFEIRRDESTRTCTYSVTLPWDLLGSAPGATPTLRLALNVAHKTRAGHDLTWGDTSFRAGKPRRLFPVPLSAPVGTFANIAWGRDRLSSPADRSETLVATRVTPSTTADLSLLVTLGESTRQISLKPDASGLVRTAVSITPDDLVQGRQLTLELRQGLQTLVKETRTHTSLAFATSDLLARLDQLAPLATKDGPDRWHLESLRSLIRELQLHTTFPRDRDWREKALTTTLAFLDTLPESGAFDLRAHLADGLPLVLAFLSSYDGSLQFTLVQLPPDWTPDAVFPLALYLHGAGPREPVDYLQRAVDNTAQDTLWRRGPDAPAVPRDAQRRCVLVSPFARGTTGYGDAALADIWQALALVEQRVKIDADRRYLTGFSMGCHGAWRVAAARPDLWAGVNLAAGFGRWSVTADARLRANTAGLPLAIWCGELDDMFPDAKTFAAAFPAGDRVHVRYVPNLPHTYPYTEYGAMLDWLFQFKRARPSSFAYEALETSHVGRSGLWLNNFTWHQNPPPARLACTIDGTTVRITAENCPRLVIEPAALGLPADGPFNVILNGEEVFSGRAPAPAFEIASKRPYQLYEHIYQLR